MRIRSKLADVEFEFGEIVRDGDQLVISSHLDAKMKSKVYVAPKDVTAMLRRLFMSPSALLFIVGLPFFYIRAARTSAKTKKRH